MRMQFFLMFLVPAVEQFAAINVEVEISEESIAEKPIAAAVD